MATPFELETIIDSPSTVREKWLPAEMAVREVVAFERRFDLKRLALACHASLPFIVTPELLNLIRFNFLDNEHIPWTAEVDFLLSPLCRAIDDGLFEVEPGVREVLLFELEEQFGWQRILDIAEFLLTYLAEKQELQRHLDIFHTQRWIALSYVDPDLVVGEMRNVLRKSFSSQNNRTSYISSQLQIATSIELTADSLARTSLKNEYRYLIRDSRVLSQLLYSHDSLIQGTIQAVFDYSGKEKITTLLSAEMLEWLVNIDSTTEQSKKVNKDKQKKLSKPSEKSKGSPTVNNNGLNDDLSLNKQKFLIEAQITLHSFDEALISRAWDFAQNADNHRKQVNGESYFSHPVGVAFTLLKINCDSTTIATALLHDVVENRLVSLGEIENEFGPEVAMLVDSVTKLAPLDQLPEGSRKGNLLQFFVATVNDPRVALIKLADRLHNLTTLGAHSVELRREIAHESLEVFAPFAEALGLLSFQSSIQDKAFRYLEPEKYEEIENKLKEKWEEFKDIRETVVELLEDALEKANIEALVYSREKEIYSIYNKMRNLERSFEDIYDLIGIRVLVNTEEDCYRANNIVDQLGTEVKFDDYIVHPQAPGGYQSLHKVIRDIGGTFIEVQICTKKMHEYNEHGPASHWLQRIGNLSNKPEFIKKMNLLREGLERLQENKSALSEEVLDGLEFQIHVFSHKGDVFYLPQDSTPIDFAYHIHTILGHECVGALVNSKIVPLEYTLKDGDIVEIIRHKGSTPHLSWIREGKVQSREAKQKIRRFFNTQKRQEMIAEGQIIVQKYLKQPKALYIDIKDIIESFVRTKILSRSTDIEDLYLAVADGRITVERLNKALGEITVKRFLEKNGMAKESTRDLAKWFADTNMIPEGREENLFLAIAEGVISLEQLEQAVRGLANRARGLPSIKTITNRPAIHHLLFRTAHCCYPVPGDSIVGFVTTGEGLSLHRSICPQILATRNRGRLNPISWEELDPSSGSMFSGQLILVLAEENSKIYRDIQQTISRNRGVMRSLTSMGKSKRPFRYSLILDIENVYQLQSILANLRKLEGVIEANRSLDDKA